MSYRYTIKVRSPDEGPGGDHTVLPASEFLREAWAAAWSARLRELVAEAEAKRARDNATPWDPYGDGEP